MSWFSDIAGKAENLLNKIDQNAAVALNNPKDEVPSKLSNSKQRSNFGVSSATNIQIQENAHEISEFNQIKSKMLNEAENNSSRSEKSVNESSSANVTEQLNGSSVRQQTPLNTRPKPPRKVPPTTKKNSESVPAAIVNGINTTNVNKKSDEELFAFLNSPNQKEIDETGLLKSELTTQAREMGLLLKNHKKLQQEHEVIKKNFGDVLKKAENSETQLDIRLEDSQKQNTVLESHLQVKNEEMARLRERLDQTLDKLQKLEQLQNVQHRLEQVELENKKLASTNDELTKQMSSLATQLEASEKQVHYVKDAILSVENEFSGYKDKAKSILKTKDELIASLKGDQNPSDGHERAVAIESQVVVEIESLKNERELLHAEVSQSRALCESLREEYAGLETEIHSIRSVNSELKEQLISERNISHSIQEENLQFSQHISGLQLDLERGIIERRKIEEKCEALKATISSSNGRSSKQDSSVGRQSNISPTPYNDNDESENLRTRITALSQSMLEKQNLINTISADKQLLQIRVERLQAQIQEMSDSNDSLSNGSLTHTVSSQPLYLSESPWDSRISGRVKRAYGHVDNLCCQVGLAMRQRPNLRLGFCAYILVLHMWVFFILFTWSHHSSDSPE